MKLIEKKCPNCGGSVEFNENDTSCKCEYCHRSFEIERDEKKEDQYVLNEKIINKMFSPLFFIAPLIIFAGFAFVIYNIYGFISNERHEESLIKDVSELSNRNFELLKTN